MEKENILRTFYNRVYEYFTLRGARRVFFFALVAVVFTAFIVNVSSSDFTMQLFMSACTICVLATLADSFQAKVDLSDQVKKIEYNHFRRLAEKSDNLAVADTGPAFSQEELLYIKREKRQINYAIAIKMVFLIFFVVFLFGGV